MPTIVGYDGLNHSDYCLQEYDMPTIVGDQLRDSRPGVKKI